MYRDSTVKFKEKEAAEIGRPLSLFQFNLFCVSLSTKDLNSLSFFYLTAIYFTYIQKLKGLDPIKEINLFALLKVKISYTQLKGEFVP